MRMSESEHQRDINEHSLQQIELERQDHEREVEEANSAPLFNIPPGVWKYQWRNLRAKDFNTRYVASNFWLGVYCSSDASEDNEEQAMLCDIAIYLCSLAI